MEHQTWPAIIGGIAGLITGTLGSLLAPWIHWGIEKRKQKRDARQDMISTFRMQLIHSLGVTTDVTVRDYFQSSIYYQIREYLDKSYVAELEKLWDMELRHPSVKSLINRLLTDLARLEKEWSLL